MVQSELEFEDDSVLQTLRARACLCVLALYYMLITAVSSQINVNE